jgi:hypothetical protein
VSSDITSAIGVALFASIAMPWIDALATDTLLLVGCIVPMYLKEYTQWHQLMFGTIRYFAFFALSGLKTYNSVKSRKLR